VVPRVGAQLWRIYCRSVLPLEELSAFHHFHLPPLSFEDLTAPPQVLLLGAPGSDPGSVAKWLGLHLQQAADVVTPAATHGQTGIAGWLLQRLAFTGPGHFGPPEFIMECCARSGGSRSSNSSSLLPTERYMQKADLVLMVFDAGSLDPFFSSVEDVLHLYVVTAARSVTFWTEPTWLVQETCYGCMVPCCGD